MNTRRTFELPPLVMRADIASIDVARRELDVTFSTGAGVQRVDDRGQRFIEQLSMDPKHIRLERLNAAGPVLDTHVAFSIHDVVGAVVTGSARIERGLAVARLRISHRAVDLWQDIEDEIVRSMSVGYRVHKLEEQPGRGALPIRLATDWEPYELSFVPIAADIGARVRERAFERNSCIVIGARVDSSREADAARLARLERLKAGAAA